MTDSDLTIANAASELRKAEKALDNHAKKGSEARKKQAASESPLLSDSKCSVTDAW
jgi:hypothetical protein